MIDERPRDAAAFILAFDVAEACLLSFSRGVRRQVVTQQASDLVRKIIIVRPSPLYATDTEVF